MKFGWLAKFPMMLVTLDIVETSAEVQWAWGDPMYLNVNIIVRLRVASCVDSRLHICLYTRMRAIFTGYTWKEPQ